MCNKVFCEGRKVEEEEGQMNIRTLRRKCSAHLESYYKKDMSALKLFSARVDTILLRQILSAECGSAYGRQT